MPALEMNYDELDAKLKVIMSLPLDKWPELVDGLSEHEKFELSIRASRVAANYALASEYLDWRGGAGYGDHGHDKAIEKAIATKKRVRKALGYNG